MISHRLLDANEVDVEALDRIDRLLEVVVALTIRALVDVERGDTKRPASPARTRAASRRPARAR